MLRYAQICGSDTLRYAAQIRKHSTGCNRGVSVATMPPVPQPSEAGSVLCICCLIPGIHGPGLSASKAVVGGGRWLNPGGGFCVWLNEITEEIIEYQESLSDSE